MTKCNREDIILSLNTIDRKFSILLGKEQNGTGKLEMAKSRLPFNFIVK